MVKVYGGMVEREIFERRMSRGSLSQARRRKPKDRQLLRMISTEVNIG
jgi:hypothetical protein